MKTAFLASVLLFAPVALVACIPEGHSADCKSSDMGGAASVRGPLEEDGCLTPIGGSCLSEEEFKAGRPAQREESEDVTRTVDDDWISYQIERPDCEFECLSKEEFLDNRTEGPVRTVTDESGNGKTHTVSLEQDHELYLERRPECEP